MKNLKYFPFERNRYFYGKLLSVDDFETEQRYMNNKRRMINRFLHGTGVVCGMNTVLVEDKMISVEMGLALDFAGREIVIDSPVIKKLSMIEGYETLEEDDRYAYLCIEYGEKEKENVHSIAASGSADENHVEYNKYAEGYRMFLTTQEPETEELSTASYFQETVTVYWGNGIRIKQVVPRYVTGGESFSLKVIVENLGQQLPIGFSYDLELVCLKWEKKDGITISFDEETVEKASGYELEYTIDAIAAKDVQGFLTVKPDSFRLTAGGKEIHARAAASSSLNLIDTGALDKILDRYYKSAMDDIVKNTYQQSIYLAKIFIIKAGESYVIDQIRNMPFQQYVFNNELASVFMRLNKEEKKNGKDVTGSSVVEKQSVSFGRQGKNLISSGTVILNLGIGGTVGQRFFSEEIAHGLGLGPVSIALGISGNPGEDGNIIFGSQDIFNEDQLPVRAELAARVNVSKGTFVIGMRCIQDTTARQVKLHWTAVKDKMELVKEREAVTMQIKPDMLILAPRESYYFEAVIGNVTEPRVIWSVKEPDGGSIDENGMYTAPNKVGVFEICARSKEEEELSTSTFVVIRETY